MNGTIIAEGREEPLTPITEPYLLVSGIPCFIDPDGRRWTDALWHKDLVEHLRYLADLTLASPVRRRTAPQNSECLSDDQRFNGVKYVDLPAVDSELSGLLSWPRTFAQIWRAAAHTQVIHAGVADWPIPTGWAATLVAVLRRRTLLMNIESSFWRTVPSDPFSKRLRSRVDEVLNRWCVRRAQIPLFTQPEYAREMLKDPERGYIFHASWINEDDVLNEQEAVASWESKREDVPIRILFVGRLIAPKGVSDLLEAVDDPTIDIRLDILGSGELREQVAEFSRETGKVRLLYPVPYGPQFFKLLQGYHALIVPSITDEQPRIVYDAYSQALPILATQTPGLIACVEDGKTGYLVPPGDVLAIRNMLKRAMVSREHLEEMGLRALTLARAYTHREMHRRRWRLLSETLRNGKSERCV
jgi:glycosyltransferase involved in cell wall biosynthesis